MAQYRIICTNQEPSNVANDRAHIVAVGTGSSASTYDKYWQLKEVLQAIDNGDSFHTFGELTRKTASVEKYNCGKCLQTRRSSGQQSG
jgi:hypothetical protein